MSLILALVLILVVLLVIDFVRKSLRLKQKQALNDIERKNREVLINQAKNTSSNVYETTNEYPLLKEGYLLFYFEAIESFQVSDLTTFLKYYGIKYTDENIFQKINSKDVIFSILPDNDKQEFENPKEGNVKRIMAVMNFKKLADLEYDVKICYEFMIDVLESLSKECHGTILNEHKLRITKKDKQYYLEAII